ncbi:MAG TPA: hypothetical protein DCZ94_21695 [Lentisphaeria bacterium]|nr:MAG: hypothetical protein A2X48_14625 [Lentisphaerae bacterium GWF2_49_21]HBC89560.1 hypothetical protein [Lentisphaeria bacterium]
MSEKLFHVCYKRKEVLEISNPLYVIGVCHDCGAKRNKRLELEKLGFNIPHLQKDWKKLWTVKPAPEKVQVHKKKPSKKTVHKKKRRASK